jgi:hypothetical protein
VLPRESRGEALGVVAVDDLEAVEEAALARRSRRTGSKGRVGRAG